MLTDKIAVDDCHLLRVSNINSIDNETTLLNFIDHHEGINDFYETQDVIKCHAIAEVISDRPTRSKFHLLSYFLPLGYT